MKPEITMRSSANANDVDLLEPLWGALQAHHASVLPSLVGAGYAGWRTGRLAELQTLSVLPQHRGEDIGGRLLDGVWSKLEERGVDEMAITTALANVDSHRFYERHGFQPAFLLYYGKRERSEG